MHLIPVRILLLLFLSSLVAAANFTQCLEDFRNDPNATGGVDSRGRPTSSAQAVGLAYRTCTVRCGSDAERFVWSDFVSSFSSWLLPWLALTGRLPFGSGQYTDDIASVVISVGSPALAAYSLILTSLNIQSVYHRARRTTHSSRRTMAKALASLQQIPLELTQDERLLGFISTTDQWGREVANRLDSRNVWSIATRLFIYCVAIAFVFTVADSFLFLNNPGGDSYQGHALGTLWLWLPCLVFGWLRLPAFTWDELRSAIVRANQRTQEAARRTKQIRQTARQATDRAGARVTNRPTHILKRPKRRVVDPVPEVDREGKKVEVEATQEYSEPVGQGVEPQVNPLPNHIRHRSTTRRKLPPKNQQHHDHPSVSVDPVANDGLFVLKNFDSLNRDEFRFAAAFNYSRIMRYLALVDDIFRALDKLARERSEEREPALEVAAQQEREPTLEAAAQPARGVFPPRALTSMFTALILALVLQCGTAVAASLVAISTPTVGVGCRSLGYILYGGTSIIIMLLTVISTILARISETRDESSKIFKVVTAFIAITLRRISLFLAFANATGLIVLSCLQFSHFFDNCYCNASVIGRGADSYILMDYGSWISTMETSRIVATSLAAASVTVYMFFLCTSSSQASIDLL